MSETDNEQQTPADVEGALDDGAAATADSEDDVSIWRSRLGYGSSGSAVAIVCNDEAEKEYLLQQLHQYRHAPEMVLRDLQEVERQIRILGPSYRNFSQSEQKAFVKQVRVHMHSLEHALQTIEQIDRPEVNPRGRKLADARNGALLQCIEAATLGMPLEVWKTRMGRYRSETTLQAFRAIYARRGLAGFWEGTSAKMVESGSKGAVLMFSKEFIKDTAISVGMAPAAAGFLAGAGGGVCQVAVMGPCTFLVTSVVTGEKTSLVQVIRSTFARHGLKGFYPGGVPIAFRQATNWASRQGFTDAIRQWMKKSIYADPTAKLSVGQEVTAGIMGGSLSCWNHPFEVARIEAQARAYAGQPKVGMLTIFRQVVAEHGVAGLFKGVIPRIGLGIYQTLFMVSGGHLIRERLLNEAPRSGH
eukprot:m.68099 g.68099  ORF g.68099 m.68099 type:complete len:416 (-) comp7718_c0_seq1:92-1339(-)